MKHIVTAAIVALAVAGTAYAAGHEPPTAKIASAGSHGSTRDAFGNVAFAVAGGGLYGFASSADSVARCPRGWHALSGGWTGDDYTGDTISISSSIATRGRAGWVVVAEDTSSDPAAFGYRFRAYVTCG